MGKTKAIFFPREDGSVPAHVNNVNEKITTGGLGVKYDWTPAEVGALGTFASKIPTDISAAEAASQTAQGLNNAKDKRIHDCELFLNDKGHYMQKHANYDPQDLEAMGMYVNHTPPDPDTAKPEVKPTVLPDMVRHDWLKKSWGGVLVWTSPDGITWSNQPQTDTRSPWEDTRPNAVPNVAEIRHYKFRYFDKAGKPIGLETIVKALVNITP